MFLNCGKSVKYPQFPIRNIYLKVFLQNAISKYRPSSLRLQLACSMMQGTKGDLFSLRLTPRCRIITDDRCSHYQINEFSLPMAVLTTRSMNSHYRWLFSLPLAVLAPRSGSARPCEAPACLTVQGMTGRHHNDAVVRKGLATLSSAKG